MGHWDHGDCDIQWDLTFIEHPLLNWILSVDLCVSNKWTVCIFSTGKSLKLNKHEAVAVSPQSALFNHLQI